MSKTVGVIGGMGPAATVDFMRRLVAATPAERDQEHLHVLVDSDPSVPDRTEAKLGRGPDPSEKLAAMARRLVAAGAELLVMPCNSAYCFADAITSAVEVPLLDWPVVVAEFTAAQEACGVGILATTGTLLGGIYVAAYDAVGVDLITPSGDDQATVMATITEIKASGVCTVAMRDRITSVAERLLACGAGQILLACSELSVLGDRQHLSLPHEAKLYDASEIAAQRVVELALS